jgi:hypothetical protein
MMASRGMGAINPSKMPGKKEITRTDDPNKVATYKRGGKVKKMAKGDLIEDAEIKPTAVDLSREYKRIGANLSGSLPLSDRDKLNLEADIAAVRAQGQGTKAALDSVKAEYQRKLDKVTTFGASMSKSPSEKRYMLSLNKSFQKGGEVWDTPNPAKKHKKLTPAKKAKAKAAAKAAGRRYPNLIDNMRMAK